MKKSIAEKEKEMAEKQQDKKDKESFNAMIRMARRKGALVEVKTLNRSVRNNFY
jgi:hypothetical protein